MSSVIHEQLIDAIKDGKRHDMDALLAAGAKFTARDGIKRSLLHQATISGQTEMLTSSHT